MAAGDHRRVRRVAPRTPPEDIADRVDPHLEPGRAKPGADLVAPLTVEIGERDAAHAAERRRTDGREIHQRPPEAVTVDAQAGARAGVARGRVVHHRAARMAARMLSAIRTSSCSVEMNGGPTAIVS